MVGIATIYFNDYYIIIVKTIIIIVVIVVIVVHPLFFANNFFRVPFASDFCFYPPLGGSIKGFFFVRRSSNKVQYGLIEDD